MLYVKIGNIPNAHNVIECLSTSREGFGNTFINGLVASIYMTFFVI